MCVFNDGLCNVGRQVGQVDVQVCLQKEVVIVGVEIDFCIDGCIGWKCNLYIFGGMFYGVDEVG